MWCYIEKKRYDAIQEILLKKKYTKMLLDENLFTNNELEYFEAKPDSVDLGELFTEINTELNTVINPEDNPEDKPESNLEDTLEDNPKNNQETPVNKVVNPLLDKQMPVTQSKKELITNSKSTNQASIPFSQTVADKFMDVTVFNNSSYMLL